MTMNGSFDEIAVYPQGDGTYEVNIELNIIDTIESKTYHKTMKLNSAHINFNIEADSIDDPLMGCLTIKGYVNNGT